MALEAQYEGTCPECRGPIIPGERIERRDDERFVHVDCPATRIARPALVCNKCWLEKPCGCDD